jgi:hypothetical protein
MNLFYRADFPLVLLQQLWSWLFSHLFSLPFFLSTPSSPISSVTFVLLGMGIPAMLPKEGKKNSKYISMIEGRHGKPADDGHGHHH